MNRTLYRLGIVLALFFALTLSLSAQVTVEVTVESGNATTTCTDAFSDPDPLWRVNIENQGWVTYPQAGFCYTALPNVQFSETYTCLSDAPSNLTVCFRALENDALIPCDVDGDCAETICQDYPMPTAAGNYTYTLDLPGGLESGGSVTFTLSISGTGAPPNDDLCDATDLGVLDFGYSFGDPNSSDYDNYCASGLGEPYPAQQWSTWYNNVGVWLSFETGPNPLPYLQVITNSDPSGLGDPLSLQIALYTSDDNTCTGNFNLEDEAYETGSWDEILLANCLEANQQYYILIDGVADTQEQLYGYYGLEITVPDVTIGQDSRCLAEDLGTIPDGGSATASNVTNVCATSFVDPNPSSFNTNKTVWFSFVPPSSGNVTLDLFSDPNFNIDGIDLEVAVFLSSNGSCTGAFQEVGSSYEAGDLDESLSLGCLDPTQTYWVMVDGSNSNTHGIFDLTITDLGDNTPVTNQEVVLCDGESISVGGNTYQATGIYTDTILLPDGCDSIIVTDLTVLDPIMTNLTIDQEASGLGNTDGAVSVNPSGGLSPYNFLWSTNETTATAVDLEGGAIYCVTVTDDNGCEGDTCFTMPYFTFIAPTFTGDTLDCFGDTDGELTFSAVGGEPPYTYAWNNDDNSLNGSGSLATAGTPATLSNLPAGDYTIEISDGMLDTAFVVSILQPDLLTADLISQVNATCFGDCDGALEVSLTGGTPPYSYVWSNGTAGQVLSNLCAGDYSLTVTDANACEAEFNYTITEPLEIQITIEEEQAISCYQGTDGALTASSNIPGATYDWSNGETSPTISGLGEGSYTVTVTAPNGCEETLSYNLIGPLAPVTVTLQEEAGIDCHGSTTGALQAVVDGPGQTFSFSWSDGHSGALNDNLPAGDYTVTVTSDLGCTAEASVTLVEPAPILYSFSAGDETCLVPGPDGFIVFDEVTGGTGPYLYSLDGQMFVDSSAFTGLSPGSYQLTIQDALGCEVSEPVLISPPPLVDVDLGEDQIIELGDPVSLAASTFDDGLVYTWVLPGVEYDCTDPECGAISFVPTGSASVFLLAVDTASFCQSTDSVFIEVRKDRRMYFPNAFSPNFDGINDIWMPMGGKGVEQIRTLQVYDRYGSLVYQADQFLPDDPAYGWDGQVRGRAGNAGVYVFFAEVEFIDGEIEIYEGDVLLVR